LEIGDTKPLTGEIKTISRGITTGRTLKSLKKGIRKGNKKNFHSRLPPMKMPKNDEPDIIFSKRDSRDIR